MRADCVPEEGSPREAVGRTRWPGRIARYLQRMLPPAVFVPLGVLQFATIYLTTQALGGHVPLMWTWRASLGAASIVLIMYLMRVWDEFKDAENDLRLARAGDNRFGLRPVLTGDVTFGDLATLRGILIGLLLTTGLLLGFPCPAAAFAGFFGAHWLSSKWYFCPAAIQKSLLLQLATHSPLALCSEAYIVALSLCDTGFGVGAGRVLILAGSLWAIILAWEVARKVRLPEDESEYQTYSKILGWRVAGILPAVLVSLSLAGLLCTASDAGLSWALRGTLVASAAVPVWAAIAFLTRPSRRRLRAFVPAVLLYGAVVNGGFVAALVIQRGVMLR